MEVFYNNLRPGYDEIVSYGPRWWTEYREMDAVYRFAGWTLDLMAHWLERIVNNQFPAYADEDTIEMFERIMDIEYDTEMTLEERRRIVSAYYSGSGHLSRSVIKALVKAYTGQDSDVYWDDLTLIIAFENSDNEALSLGILQKILRRRMPVHIAYQLRCKCTVHLRIGASRRAWAVDYPMCGTRPKTSTGLRIAEAGLEIETDSRAYELTLPCAGTSGEAGQYPMTSTGLGIAGTNVKIDTETETYGLAFPVAGQSGEAGQYPGTSTGLAQEHGGLVPEVSTQSWSVAYTLCGEDL